MNGEQATYMGSISWLHGTIVEVLGMNPQSGRWSLLLPNGETLQNVRYSSIQWG